MKLDAKSIKNEKPWKDGGFELPLFDRDAMILTTGPKPEWIHFGSGNIFRAFLASVQQTLLNAGTSETGIIVAEGYDSEFITRSYRPFDNLCVLVTLKTDGNVEKKVLGSVAESLIADTASPDWKRIIEVFKKPSLKMASFTITEKGYSLTRSDGSYIDEVKYDLENGPAAPRNIIGKLASLCLERYKNGAVPLALVSMDNCSHNGEKLHDAMIEIVNKWASAGFVESSFVEYMNDPKRISFPWTMIDKITPRPDDSVKVMLEKAGYESAEISITEKKSWTASFVNAEEAQYLIVEDLFPNGKLPLDKGGVIYTDRNTVNLVEKMKVCTCLNPLHTALAVFGCLLGHTSIHEEMHDVELKALVEKIGYVEGLPVVVNPGIINPKDFINEVINVRFPNPFMTDTPQRIATDTSKKLGIRFGETIKEYQKRPELSVSDLVFIPLVLAGWLRYLLAVDDDGNAFEPSPDPMLEAGKAQLKGINIGSSGPFHAQLAPLLSNAEIFGLDLYKAGLGERVEGYFAEFVAQKGSVRKTLAKYLKK